jgi:tripartite-type tricarboxylate transporter receptor subunit TctC
MALAPLSTLAATEVRNPCSQLKGRRIRWIVPYSPGGGYDTYSRLIAPLLEARLNAKIGVENFSGAGGMLGAYQVFEARPDGRTVGIMNGSGLLIAWLTEAEKRLNPATDFSILGRVVRSKQVWVVTADSPFRTMSDFFAESERRPIVFAVSGVGGNVFLNAVIGSDILGLNSEIVAGYEGSRESSLAVLRGEVDLTSMPFESALDRIEAGELRPILQIGNAPISDHPSLTSVRFLGGEDGVAAGRAAETGKYVPGAVSRAGAMVALFDAGVLVVAPPGMKDPLLACLRQAVFDTLGSAEFHAAAKQAKRSIEVTSGSEAQAELEVIALKAETFREVVRKAIEASRADQG